MKNINEFNFFKNKEKSNGTLYIVYAERFNQGDEEFAANSISFITNENNNYNMYYVKTYHEEVIPEPDDFLNKNIIFSLFPFTKKIYPKWDILDFLNPKSYINHVKNLRGTVFATAPTPKAKKIYATFIEEIKYTKMKSDDVENNYYYTFNGKYLNGVYTWCDFSKDFTILARGKHEIEK